MKTRRQSATVAIWQPHPLNRSKMDITYAVENAHDENILTHPVPPLKKELYLSFMLSLLTLEPHPDDSFDADEETLRMRQRLLMYKAEVDALDRNADDYYEKKEQLIFKIFCEFRGPVYEPELQECSCESEENEN